MNGDTHKIKCVLDDRKTFDIVNTDKGQVIISYMWNEYLLRYNGIDIVFDEYRVDKDYIRFKLKGWSVGGIQF